MNIVHLADCLPAMREMEDNAFDLAVVDPPYGIGNFNQDKHPSRPYNKNWAVTWNESAPAAEYFNHLLRISQNTIIWGVNYYREYVPSGAAIVWDKGNNSDVGSQFEIASLSIGTRVVKYTEQWTGFCRSEKGEKIHPCQKPIALYKWIYANYAKPGQTILDTHVGSGSSRIAAWDAGLDFVGYEIDADYHAAQETISGTHETG